MGGPASGASEKALGPAAQCALRIDALVSSPEAADLFGADADDEALLERLRSEQELMVLLPTIPLPIRDSIAAEAQAFKSWREYGPRWRIALTAIEQHVSAQESKAEEEEGSEEEEGDEERPEEEESETDDPVGGQQVDRIAKKVAETYSYLPEFWSWFDGFRQSKPAVGRFADRSEGAFQRADGGLKRFQRALKRAIQFLGITGILGGAYVLMKNFPVYRVVLKLLGTLLYIAYPLYLLFKNPIRRLTNWILEDISEEQIPAIGEA